MNLVPSSFPAWATDDAACFFAGFFAVAMVNIFSAALRWFRAVADPHE